MKNSERIYDAITNTIQHHQLLEPGQTILVALSGGADSVCLLHALWHMQAQLGISLRAAHLNHGIRGEEAERDQRFVEGLCKKLDIPLDVRWEDVPELAARRGSSLEEAGRAARYHFFYTLRDKYQIHHIATAHNRNDQAETVLMRVMRGTGTEGLRGIRYSREDGVIRPLLDVERHTIEDYCREMQLEYCIDSTNEDTAYTRNKIRRQLIPFLQQEFNPNILGSLAALAANTGEDADFIKGYTQRLYRRLGSPIPKQTPVLLDIESLKMVGSAGIQNRLLVLAARDTMGSSYSFEHKHITALRELWDKETGTCAELPGGLRVRVQYGWLEFTRGEREEKVFADALHYDVEMGSVYDMGAWNVSIELKKGSYEPRENQMVLDYDKVRDLPLTIRFRRRGDRIAVFRDGRSRKLKDYMIDKKIPRRKRDHIPLLCSGAQVIAILGERVAEPYRIDKNTQERLVLSYDTDENENW